MPNRKRFLGALAVPLAILGVAAAPAAAATIAYPDLEVNVPTSSIAIVSPSSGVRQLEFTHITWDAGAGPLEIRPSYNSATGVAQGYQALYTSPSPGTWTYDHSVPIVGPMIWDPPSDYRFPMSKFWLYTAASGGGIGTLVATSPKVDFCMTSDVLVGGVPNTPSSNTYSPGNCSDPNGTLGLTVGWGDQYDQTDAGENIDISSLPDGTYWLRAEADPFHYFAESNAANNITDTELQITGTSVQVLAQTHPDSTPPAVTLTSPAANSAATGSVALAASASGPAPITSVQFLLDGQPIGSPVTSSPYTATWTVGSTTPGLHYLSAQATDSRGFVGTAPAVAVTVPDTRTIGSIGFDTTVSATGTGSVTTPQFTTAYAGDTLLAFVSADGPKGAGAESATVSGAGLSWSLVKRANGQPGDAEVWEASAPSTVVGGTVTSTLAAGAYAERLTVLALDGTSGIGASGASSLASGAPSVSIASTAAGSAVLGVGDDWDNAISRTLGTGQAMLDQYLNVQSGDTFWSQYLTSASAASGQTMTLDDTAPTSDRSNFASVEVLPSGSSPPPDTTPPTVSITAPAPGATVSGNIQVSANATDDVAVASVQFYLDGTPLGSPVTAAPYAITWSTTTATNGSHLLSATATDTSGNTASSPYVGVTVQNPTNPGPCFVMDANVTVNGNGSVTTPAFTTASAGEQLLAFVSSDGPMASGAQSVTVSGAGLTWKLVKRSNGQPGDAEVWWATAATALSKVKVTSTPSAKGYDQTLSVISEQMSKGIGNSAVASALSGPPSVTLTTAQAGSLVFAVGEDWDNALARTLGPNQSMLHQYLDTGTGDTMWSQFTSSITGAAGSSVTLNDTAPTGDRYDLAAVELVGDGAGQ